MKAVRQKGTFSYPAFMGCQDYWQNEFLTQKIQFRTRDAPIVKFWADADTDV